MCQKSIVQWHKVAKWNQRLKSNTNYLLTSIASDLCLLHNIFLSGHQSGRRNTFYILCTPQQYECKLQLPSILKSTDPRIIYIFAVTFICYHLHACTWNRWRKFIQNWQPVSNAWPFRRLPPSIFGMWMFSFSPWAVKCPIASIFS